jgi:hypothetical protein
MSDVPRRGTRGRKERGAEHGGRGVRGIVEQHPIQVFLSLRQRLRESFCEDSKLFLAEVFRRLNRE